MITVVDYGMGNVWSVISALQYLGLKPELTSDPAMICDADYIVLPGVGSFRKGMMALHERGLDTAIQKALEVPHVKIIGICLGMQLLGSCGMEDGETEGLNLIPCLVDRFTRAEVGIENKIPHVGFNGIEPKERSGLFHELPEKADFYFTHSYRMLPENLDCNIGVCDYGVKFLAAFENGNVCGTQFHPEKSQTNGLILLRNFFSGPSQC